jgi:hypothetical protein
MQFDPIDYKDSSAKYRADVWNGIATELLQESIVPITDLTEVVSLWKILNGRDGSVAYFQAFDVAGFVKRYLKNGHISEWKFSVGPGSIILNDKKYHCALSATGKLVIFNGDGSLCLVGLRCDEISWE